MVIIGAILSVVVFIALLYIVRKLLNLWMRNEPTLPIDPLEELRRLRDVGELSPQEFDDARKRIVAQTKAKLSE